MFNSLSKVIVIVVAVLIAFLGQAFAYASMTCEMSTDSHQSHQVTEHSSHLPSMNHEGMEHSATNESASQSHEECCDSDCVCPTTGCTTVSVANSAPNQANLERMNQGVFLHRSNQTKSIYSSLFRPPIFA